MNTFSDIPTACTGTKRSTRALKRSTGEGHYQALAFANDAGGYEVRNARFKGSLGHKDITSLALPGSQRAAVFEGVFDFLSVLAHYGRERA